MSVTSQHKILPLGQLLQNEPHLRLHTLRLARNANFLWSETVAVNGGISLVDGEPIELLTDATWPAEGWFLARAERPDDTGTTAPWVFMCFVYNTQVSIEFPDLAIGPTSITSASGWQVGAVEFDLPVGEWHKFTIHVSREGGALFSWAVWGERPLLSADLVPDASGPSNTSSPSAYGTGLVGEVLTCAPGSWSGYPAPTYTYQWYRAPSTTISGADSHLYTVDASDVGYSLFCRVTAANASGSTSADSNAISAAGSVSLIVTNTGDVLITSGGDSIKTS